MDKSSSQKFMELLSRIRGLQAFNLEPYKDKDSNEFNIMITQESFIYTKYLDVPEYYSQENIEKINTFVGEIGNLANEVLPKIELKISKATKEHVARTGEEFLHCAECYFEEPNIAKIKRESNLYNLKDSELELESILNKELGKPQEIPIFQKTYIRLIPSEEHFKMIKKGYDLNGRLCTPDIEPANFRALYYQRPIVYVKQNVIVIRDGV